jgi:hypothetical protein
MQLITMTICTASDRLNAAIFFKNDQVNGHNCRIWGQEWPHGLYEHLGTGMATWTLRASEDRNGHMDFTSMCETPRQLIMVWHNA